MNKNDSKEIEKEFLELRETMTEEQWNDPAHLYSIAGKYEKSHPALAIRIMKRVKNLNNKYTKKVQQKIEEANQDSQNSKSNTKVEGEEKVVQDDNKVSDTLNNKKRFDYRQIFILIRKPLYIFVVIPWVLFFIYQTLIASPRYISDSQIIVEQPDSMATLDTGMAILSGLGVKPTGTDAELVKAFIYSSDLIEYLDEKINLREHYSSSSADIFSRLGQESSTEAFYTYYEKHVEVNVDQKSQVINIRTQGFDPKFAQALNKLIVERSEWYINQIGNKLAEEQLKFVQKEHALVEERIKKTKKELLQLQSKYGLLDPEAEGLAIQKIAYSLESLIAQRKAELKALRSVMSDTAPQVTSIISEINALEQQLMQERERLTDNEDGESVSEIMAKFIDLKVDIELALQAYTSSQVSLEKSRVEAYRQIKYLVVVESPTLAQENAYPTVFYNLSLLAVSLLMLFGIGRIIYSTIHEISK